MRIKVAALGAWMMLTAGTAIPHETGLDIPSAQSREVLVPCIERKLGGSFLSEKSLDSGGVSIQAIKYPNSPFFGHPTLYFDISEADGNRHINIHYRHPMSKDAAAKWTRIIGRKCFPYELDAAGGGRLPEGAD